MHKKNVSEKLLYGTYIHDGTNTALNFTCSYAFQGLLNYDERLSSNAVHHCCGLLNLHLMETNPCSTNTNIKSV